MIERAKSAESAQRQTPDGNTSEISFLMTNRRKASLILEDGTTFEGFSFGAESSVSGELVFQTGMVGYPESLTDPSYRKQLLVLTFPLIGNYGVPASERDSNGILKYFESEEIHPTALIVSDYSDAPSHWNCKKTLGTWLKENKVVGLCGIDTRALTKKIRESGSILAKIVFDNKDVEFLDPNKLNLVDEVSTKAVKYYGKGDKTILAIDCGIKANQLRCFLERGVRVKVVPWDYDIFKERDYDGVFISNGPGDPTFVQKTIDNIHKLIEEEDYVPVFGICLGNQLLGLAAGGTTYKMKYGNRGHNQPCVDLLTKRCHLTMQNHGYALDPTTLKSDWIPLFVNANDNTNEGLMHKTKPFFGVQFHPEAKGGPTDTSFLFDKFLSYVRNEPFDHPLASMPSVSVKPMKKILLLGSGALTIGQAGEFDYSGSLAIKALKEENINVILINPNVATVQTTTGLADKIYFLPVTPEFVTRVMELEKPDGILVTFGGQTALNCGIELYKNGVFERLGVEVLGTPMESIYATEDREVFSQKMAEIGEGVAPSCSAKTIEEAIEVGDRIGYPVIVRSAFALGGLGSGFADNREQLVNLVTQGLAVSPQVLIDKSLKGWKEIEYEVVRDAYDNCITVTNMENFDPLGVHTGESIVVAPSQTLSDNEYHMLRRTAIKVIRHLKIVGECNIQYALNPESEEYCIIEVNARLSRSSALASKATGYPLAFIAAKLALGTKLDELRNSVTKVTTACFEPSLDYVVVKMPVWDLKKFERVKTKIDSSMKSVGEVMSLGRTFEESMQKAIRMVNQHADGFQHGLAPPSDEELEFPSDQRIFVLASAFKEGMTVERAHQLTKIDRWFLTKLKRIIDLENYLTSNYESNLDAIPVEFFRELKRLGFSDKQIARCISSTELKIREKRTEMGIVPFVKQIDTVAAEVAAQNNYLYMTYSGSEHDINFNDHGYMVIGSGGYRIGSSVEFDWCAVSAITTLKKMGYKAIMVNYNPETVSTDYDVCDRLYFEELTLESVLNIYELEKSLGVLISMGGQIPNNLAIPLWRNNVNILGTSPEMIDNAENRYKFSRLLDSIGVDQPKWKELTDINLVKDFCHQVGYPVLVRPSYVLSGAAMNIVHSDGDLNSYLTQATAVSKDHPVVVSKFIEYAKEIEMDAVAKDGELMMHCISEHVENAGVHSGDASLVFPAQDLDQETIHKVTEATRQIAKALLVTGPFNIQFLAKDNQIKVIECNLRASRSFPFVSKTLNFNLIELATRIIVGGECQPYPVDIRDIDHVGVKVAQFSFSRLQGADPVTGVEMSSTGEVGCFGKNRYEAFLKAVLSTGLKIPKKNIFLSIGSYKEKMEFLNFAKKLSELGYNLFASHGTADFLSAHEVPVSALDWSEEVEGESSIEKHFSNKNIHLCIICPSKNYRRSASFFSRGYITRRKALEFNVPLITNIKFAKMLVESLTLYKDYIPIESYDIRESRRILVLPGLIDMHVHVRDPGQTHKEDWDSCTAAALSGGITMIGAMPNTQPSIVDQESFDLVSKLANEKARCDYGIYVGANMTNYSFLPKIAPDSAIAVKMYLDKTFTTLKLDSMGVWMEHFKHWPKDFPICCHSEGSNMAAVILLASLYDRPVHICHLSRKDEIELVRQAKLKGIKVTCEVTPHHLFLDEEDVKNLGEKRSKVAPKLNSSEDRKALWQNMDIIDCFATDHAPHTVEEKDGENPPPGFPGLETSLSLFLTAVNEGRLTIEDIIEKMYTNPRKIYGLPEQPDTYVEVDLDEVWKIPDELPYSKSKWTPFSGKTVVGRVRRVVLHGETAYLDGKVLAPPGFGKNVQTGRVREKPRTKTVSIDEESAPESPVSPAAKRERKTSISRSPKTTVEVKAKRQEQTLSSLFEDIPTTPTPPGSWFRKDILSIQQFTRDDAHFIFTTAAEIKMMSKRVGLMTLCQGKVLANIFYEPSTRTSCSFAAAMQRLGGSVINVNQEFSSVQKGESLEDTIRTMECYSDVLVLRHPEKGSAQMAAKHCSKPVINAGDGVGEHPTQALLDAFTIREELGTINGLTITLVGDLKNGRTVHSLVQLLSLYNITLHYVSPESLRMPQEVMEAVRQRGISQTEHTDLNEVLPITDVLYVTRIQKERFEDIEEYEKVKSTFIISTKTLTKARSKMIVMHPLPRNQEISPEFDSDPRAAYFRQMENGMYIRMALLALILGKV